MILTIRACNGQVPAQPSWLSHQERSMPTIDKLHFCDRESTSHPLAVISVCLGPSMSECFVDILGEVLK